MEKTFLKPDYIFENSWEVCNLVGGIYTVLSTKAQTLQKSYKDRIVFVGPDIWEKTESPFFIPTDDSFLKDWLIQASNEGLKVRIGRWDIPGKPIVVLVDFRNFFACKNQLFGDMWNWYGVNSIEANGDYDESCVFAYASARVIESIYQFIDGKKYNVVAHFDEWTTGMGELYLKHRIPEIATIFTTHATSIGRSIAGNGKPLYDYLSGYRGDQMAQELNMVSKHSLEKQAALHADCFTTVSDITAKECTQLLERTPDIVTPNGFESTFVPKGESYKSKRNEAREILLRVASNLMGYTPDKDAFLVATSGRYEYKNKGIDLFIEAIRQLKEQNNTGKEIIAFILVPAYVDKARADLQERLKENQPGNGGLPDPYITHNLHNFGEDRVINHFRAANFTNEADNKVKIIFVPSYLTGSDGVFNKSYYDLLIGLDATVFPSYYEPWGYTPLESIAFGIPTITTSLSGFGQWILHLEKENQEATGVVVLNRTDSNFEEVKNEIADVITQWSNKTKKEKNELDKAAAHTAQKAEWKHFIEYYNLAFDMALRKVGK